MVLVGDEIKLIWAWFYGDLLFTFVMTLLARLL